MSSIAARRVNTRVCQLQPNGTLSRGIQAYPGANGGRSGGWNSPNTRLVPQCSNPHLGRLSLSGDTFHHIIRWNVEIIRELRPRYAWTKSFVFSHSLIVYQRCVVFCSITAGTPFSSKMRGSSLKM